ncbi:MAG: hypothetical protein KJ964_01145 [Verrucomicrobia bacterium]|nr:hypothetical protein [Verrucomicrobiota bacterium]MBU1735420.1 hypothetical protein [Verrucomicrobiota bacterium]MBU1857425.1 hypothetical protein [Verrucomicrobiota bacterium]
MRLFQNTQLLSAGVFAERLPLKRCLFVGGFTLLMGLRALNGFAAEQKENGIADQSPFFASSIAVEPGGNLMLHPKLPYIEGLPDEEYNLVLNFPAALSPSRLQVMATDQNGRIDAVSETLKDLVVDGRKRVELSYKPDLALAMDGMELYLVHINKAGSAYVPIIKFAGTFDWKTFRKEVQVSDDNVAVIPILLKWATNPTQTGTLSCRGLQISEADGGKVIFNFRPKEPVVMKLGKGQSGRWLSEDPAKIYGDKVKLIPGKKYIVECQAKGEEIGGPGVSSKDALTKKVAYTRTLVFDIAQKISLPDKLIWRIEGKAGKVYAKGDLALVAAKKRITPKVIDASSWLCETSLHSESLPVQKLYVGKLHAWGLNTIEPQMPVPAYDAPLTEESLSIPVAQEAKRLRMRVRTYMHFLYDNKNSESYLKANPQFAAIGPMGKRTSNYPFICPTHYLENGNPWLKYYLDAIRKSVEINDSDGVFYDFEINAAPYIKSLPNKDGSRRWGGCCICERCRKAFQASIGLDHVPSVEECCEDALYEKWTDFRCRQNVELWRLTSQAAKAGNPRATFAIYSGGPGDYSRQAYGVDWIMAVPYLDFAMQRYFSPIPVQAADGFSAALAKGMPEKQAPPRMLFQLNVFPYSDQWMYGCDANRTYAELLNIKNDIVRTVAVCRSFGWSFTGIWGLDDQLTLPIKEANALLARYENYFVNGAKVANLVKVEKGDVEIATWRKGKRLVTFVFNRKAQPQDVVLKMEGVPQPIEAKYKVEAHDCHVNEWPGAESFWHRIFSWWK